MTRKFLAFFLLITLTLSSVAMPGFTHVCYGMDKTWSSLFVPPSSCCASTASETKGCKVVSFEKQGFQFDKLPCCENEISLEALGATYTPEILAGIPFPSFAAILPDHSSSYGIHSYENTRLQKIASDQSPTLRYGRSLLIFEQLFLC